MTRRFPMISTVLVAVGLMLMPAAGFASAAPSLDCFASLAMTAAVDCLSFMHTYIGI